MPDLAGLRNWHGDTGFITGTVITPPSGGVAVVDIGGVQLNVNVVRGLTPATGDIVLVSRQGSARWLMSILFTSAPPTPVDVPDTPPPPVPTTQTGTNVFTPTYTGTYRSGKWRTDTDNVIQGQWYTSSYGENHGAVFYGRGPHGLSGATCTKATLKMKRMKAGEYGARPPSLRLITQLNKPAGAPSYGSTTAGPSMAVLDTVTFTLPTSWGQALIDGTAGGIGLDANGSVPYIVMAGKAEWSSAFVLSISWRRTT